MPPSADDRSAETIARLEAEVERWKGKVFEEREKWMRILDEREQEWQVERDELTARAMQDTPPVAAPPLAMDRSDSPDVGPSADLMRLAMMGMAGNAETADNANAADNADPPEDLRLPAPAGAASYALYEKPDGAGAVVTAVVDLPGGRRRTSIALEPSVHVQVTSTADAPVGGTYGTRVGGGAAPLRSEQREVSVAFELEGVADGTAPRVILDNSVLALQWQRVAPQVTHVG